MTRDNEATDHLPLRHLRVIELGHALAGPLAATLLGDFGADIVKVERVDGGDSLRGMGPQHNDQGVWWSVTGRNKRSVCVDYKDPRGHEVLMDLIAGADVVVENFRPGVLDRAGFGWKDLSERFPRMIMLRISGYGQTGPYSARRGFGKIAEAFSGATFLTGEKDRPPLHPGFSLGDATTGLMGAFGVMVALAQREESGEGQLVDLALYEPLFRLIEWQLPLVAVAGELPTRNGPRFPFDGAFITDICIAADGESVVVSAATADSVARLRSFLEREGLLAEEAPQSEVGEGLRVWIGRHGREEVLERLEEAGLVVGGVYSAADLLEDPHVAARGNIVDAVGDDGVKIPMPSALPSLSATPGRVRWPGPRLGQHTREVLCDMPGYGPERVDELLRAGVVAGDS